MAQEAAPISTDAQTELCRVYAISGPEGQPSDLRANCNGRGLMLGRATEFEAIISVDLSATLVDVRLGSDRRVLLLSTQPDGRPLVEDLTGQIALAAGRGPMSTLEGVELDFEGFSARGEIGVRGRPEDTGSAKADRLNLAEQVAFERARRSAIAAQQE